MGTHAVLGVQMPDNSITACYVHYDGSTMRPRIERFFDDGNTTTCLVMLITEAQSSGGMRSFHSPMSETMGSSLEEYETEFLDDDEPFVIDETSFWGADHYGARIWYLVNYKTNEIIKRTR